MKNPTLTIILVTYRSEDNIVSLLDSLKKSVGNYSFEVIVIDNYPKDKSADLAQKHLIKPSVIRNKENLGFSKAVNIGLRQAKGEYILLLNPDTRPIGLALKYLVDFAVNHPNLGAVAPKLLDYSGKIQPSCSKFPTILNAIKHDFLRCETCFKSYYPGNKTTEVEVAVMAAFLIPSRVIKKIGGLDERFFLYYEDIEYCRRLWRNKYPVYFYPKPQVKHIRGASGGFTFHLKSPLLASAKEYYGPVYSSLLNTTLWVGHKWQVILRRKRFRD